MRRACFQRTCPKLAKVSPFVSCLRAACHINDPSASESPGCVAYRFSHDVGPQSSVTLILVDVSDSGYLAGAHVPDLPGMPARELHNRGGGGGRVALPYPSTPPGAIAPTVWRSNEPATSGTGGGSCG